MAAHCATAAAPLDKEPVLFQTRISRNSLLWTLPWLLLSVGAHAADAKQAGKSTDTKTDAKAEDSKAAAAVTHFVPEQQSSKGSVAVEGRHIDYDAYAGTIVVHPKDWDDVPQNAPKDEDKSPRPEASMFYVAYFKSGDKAAADKNGSPRPVTFLFNGGPGSSTVWLHMGAFGPRRVVTADDSHTAAAP